MKSLRFLLPLGLCISWPVVAQVSSPAVEPAATTYLITNDDPPRKIGASSGTVFTIASDGTPQSGTKVTLGGSGAGGGLFNANRVSVLRDSACAFLSINGAGEIGGIDLLALQDVGNTSGSSTDGGFPDGIGLANNGSYLYASYSASSTIATFSILPGCSLTFLGDIAVSGKQSGNVKGMAAHGNLLVVAYGDGSIQSFNISGGIPVSNGDLQNATGYDTSRFPAGVDITQNGHYAIFGDQSTTSTVEVSDISSGKLIKTKLYDVGAAGNAANIYLSPDQTLLYIANTNVGKVTAAFFNAATGKVSRGCSSAKLRGFPDDWQFLASPVTELNTGTGSVLYLSEYGAIAGIAIVNVSSSGGKCTLAETAASPLLAPTTTLLSIGVYPPRQF
jgi:6-phosphogluconolactonase (cycloisomerase 2 family)